MCSPDHDDARGGLYGALGSAMGLLIAVPYSRLMVKASGVDTLEFPAAQLIGVVLALSTLTALAGALPVRRAARVSPMTALSAAG
ncbi:hypothetical protein [Streptomyces sp. NPDC001843]|uniref:hypothetical protein n=1 Tax=Streptomyces sp. NPDC001843 TaxID=3364617 RepID=UPI003688F694